MSTVGEGGINQPIGTLIPEAFVLFFLQSSIVETVEITVEDP